MRTLRLLGAVALACGTVPVLTATPAHAETGSFTGVTSGYFSSTGIRKPDALPASIPEPVQPNNQGADGVSPGNLPVAARAGAVDKQSFVLFDLLSLPIGTTIDKAVLTAPLVPTSQTDATYAAEPAKVVACPSGDEGFFGEDGSAIEDSPTAKCDVASVPAKANAAGTAYEFDITKIAATWIDANDGIAVTAAEGARTTPFQVVFGKAADWKLALTYTLPTEETALPPLAPAPVAAPPVDLGFSGGVAAPPLDSGFVAAPVPAPAAVPAPVAQPAPAPVAVLPAAAPVAIESLRPDASLWWAGLGLALLLALVSLVMGDGRVPTRTGSSSQLAKALGDRSRATARPAFGRALPV